MSSHIKSSLFTMKRTKRSSI